MNICIHLVYFDFSIIIFIIFLSLHSFAPIFSLNFLLLLNLYAFIRIYNFRLSWIFKIETKSKIFGDYFFVILSIHTPSLGHLRSQKLLQLNRFSRFDVNWIQTNQQQTRKVYIMILISKVS